MREDKSQFRFSYDQRFRKVSFGKFLKIARELCEAVVSIRNSVDITVITSEDHRTYDYSTVTFMSDEITEALKGRKEYPFDRFTQNVWDRSFNVQVTLKDKKDPKPFMICLSCNKHADAKRIMFYGQCLDETTYQRVVSKFRHPTLLYSIGEGFEKSSDFNVAMGRRLVGM